MSIDVPPSSPSADKPLLGYASGFHPPVEGLGTTWRLGDQVVVENGTTMPKLCILCGAEAEGAPIRLTLTWDESFHVTHVSTLALRRKAIVHAFLCPVHRGRWLRGRIRGGIGALAGGTLMAGGIALGVISESSDMPRYTSEGVAAIVLGFAGVIVSLFYFTFKTRTLTCRRIQEGYLYLEGAAAEFLARLPELPQK